MILRHGWEINLIFLDPLFRRFLVAAWSKAEEDLGLARSGLSK